MTRKVLAKINFLIFYQKKLHANQEKKRIDIEEVKQQVHYSATTLFELSNNFCYLHTHNLILMLYLCNFIMFSFVSHYSSRIQFRWFQFLITIDLKDEIWKFEKIILKFLLVIFLYTFISKFFRELCEALWSFRSKKKEFRLE